MSEFTVVGYIEESGQIFADFVVAENGLKAFRESAKERPLATFIVALKGHVAEGQGAIYAGSGVVAAETIMEQTDVF